MDNLYGNEFIDMIKMIVPHAKVVSGGREIVTRCPYCGDSKNQRSAHFYISVPTSHEELSFYDCKRASCGTSGILDDKVLRKLGCNNSNLLVQLQTHNSKILKLPKYKRLKSINIYPLKNVYLRQDNYNNDKLNYINNRLGSNYTFKDLMDLKIVFNLYDLINMNKLELTRHKMVTDNLDRYFIGFISYDNSFCGMRKYKDVELHKSVNKRYINYNLVNKIDNSKNYYIIPTQIDVFNPTPIKIHIAEGQFDILSIYHNLNNDNNFQNIYIASGGKGYIQALEFILTEFGIVNYELHFYPDMDIDDMFFSDRIISVIKILPSDIYIHRNIYNGEKDFGVPSNRIKENVKVIREIEYV